MSLDDPLALRCGLTLPNRLCKASTSEHLATARTNDATDALVRLYDRWADGRWARRPRGRETAIAESDAIAASDVPELYDLGIPMKYF